MTSYLFQLCQYLNLIQSSPEIIPSSSLVGETECRWIDRKSKDSTSLAARRPQKV